MVSGGRDSSIVPVQHRQAAFVRSLCVLYAGFLEVWRVVLNISVGVCSRLCVVWSNQ